MKRCDKIPYEERSFNELTEREQYEICYHVESCPVCLQNMIEEAGGEANLLQLDIAWSELLKEFKRICEKIDGHLIEKGLEPLPITCTTIRDAVEYYKEQFLKVGIEFDLEIIKKFNA